jgi:hypothetical protein
MGSGDARKATPPNPPFQPTTARGDRRLLAGSAQRLQRLNGNPLGGSCNAAW